MKLKNPLKRKKAAKGGVGGDAAAAVAASPNAQPAAPQQPQVASPPAVDHRALRIAEEEKKMQAMPYEQRVAIELQKVVSLVDGWVSDRCVLNVISQLLFDIDSKDVEQRHLAAARTRVETTCKQSQVTVRDDPLQYAMETVFGGEDYLEKPEIPLDEDLVKEIVFRDKRKVESVRCVVALGILMFREILMHLFVHLGFEKSTNKLAATTDPYVLQEARMWTLKIETAVFGGRTFYEDNELWVWFPPQWQVAGQPPDTWLMELLKGNYKGGLLSKDAVKHMTPREYYDKRAERKRKESQKALADDVYELERHQAAQPAAAAAAGGPPKPPHHALPAYGAGPATMQQQQYQYQNPQQNNHRAPSVSNTLVSSSTSSDQMQAL